MYFKNRYLKYSLALIVSSCIAAVGTISINSENIIQLSDIVRISNLYTVGSTSGLIESLIAHI